ncbi:S8 family serine peptidase [Vibrio neonatus]|uniref:S8 family serine peptidase n=1 Tax=Vibrio neonatus TaxID=278860 RepID=UPI0021C3942D|nr:S8 family serine peptidase [Vibrio neonatus]
MKKNTFIVCLAGLGLLSGCGGESSGTSAVQQTAHNKQLFEAVPQEAQFQIKALQPNSNNVVYTDAGRLVRFENSGHTLSLVDTKGVKNGAIRQDDDALLYIPQTAAGEMKSSDKLVYKEDDVEKTITIQINSDPLYPEQWHLHNLGQTSYTDYDLAADGQTDVHMSNAVASGYLGKGVTVAVVDHGAQLSHPDLNVGEGSMNLADGSSYIPIKSGHGTSVAGIIAEKGWNNIGGRGVAPEAKIISFNYLDVNGSVLDFARSHGFSKITPTTPNGMPIIDESTLDGLARVYNESWATLSFCGKENDPWCAIDNIRSEISRKGATLGFDGKGIIYIKGSANNEQGYTWIDSKYYEPIDKKPIEFFGFDPQAEPTVVNHGLPFRGAMMSIYQNSPYLTIVGSVTAQGKQASYSGSGANMFVSGLGGEKPYGRIITTDIVGCNEFTGFSNLNVFNTFVEAFDQGQTADNQHCDYNASMDGTSAATPVVSGAVADMLSVNDSLSWRDVRDILARTAQKVDPQDKAVTLPLKDGDLIAQYAWVTNGAGLNFNNKYGFGLVDIDKAITLAKTYNADTLGRYIKFPKVESKKIDKGIPEASAKGIKDELAVDNSGIIETVSLHVNIDHERLNDLQVELISPSGTHAIALNPYNGIPLVDTNPANRINSLDFTFAINTFWGEDMQGKWTLRVFDANDQGYSQNVSASAIDYTNAKKITVPNNAVPGVIHSWSIQVNGHAKKTAEHKGA